MAINTGAFRCCQVVNDAIAVFGASSALYESAPATRKIRAKTPDSNWKILKHVKVPLLYPFADSAVFAKKAMKCATAPFSFS